MAGFPEVRVRATLDEPARRVRVRINEGPRYLSGDVIIAVNISTPPLKRDEITSALTVTTQLINFLGKQTVDQQIRSLGPNDVLISPDLGNISAGSFDRSKDAIRIGEEATRALAGKLARYSVSPEQYAALRSHDFEAFAVAVKWRRVNRGRSYCTKRDCHESR